MNGRTAKLVNKYARLTARLSGEPQQRRAMKRGWSRMLPSEREAVRQELRIANSSLAATLAVKESIQTNRNVRRQSLDDGTRALWFLNDSLDTKLTQEETAKLPMNATFFYEKNGRVWGASITPEQPFSPMPGGARTFEKFWTLSVEDDLPAAHQALIKNLAVSSKIQDVKIRDSELMRSGIQ